MEAVGEREKVAVMVMGKMRDTDRMVVKDSKTGETVEVARKVTFNPAIRARTVTVEGDVFEPSGIVEAVRVVVVRRCCRCYRRRTRCVASWMRRSVSWRRVRES